MALYSSLSSLSQVAASNAADGSVDAPSTIDQQTNLLASFIAQLRDGAGFTTGVGYLGQCRLAKSGANLVLSRFNGVGLTINGVAYAIPSAGVSLAPTSLSVNTTYYIYAYMSGGTMTLEASATGHATDTTTGIEIKSGDATRTLVGMARTITGPAWVDTAAQRFVVSWFNRRAIKTSNAFSSATTTTSASYVELNSAVRCEFLSWGDEGLGFAVTGGCSNGTATAQTFTAVGMDSTTVAQDGFTVAAQPAGINNQLLPVAVTSTLEPTEGYHFASVLGLATGGTSSWTASVVAGSRTIIQGLIKG